VTYALFAAPSYVARRGAPVTPAELAGHALVLSTQTRQRRGQWVLTHGAEQVVIAAAPRLLVNTHLAVRDAVIAGLGVGLLPEFQAAAWVEAGALVPVVPGWGRAPVAVHAVYASHRYLAPKVRAFVELARAGFAQLGRAGTAGAGRARPSASRVRDGERELGGRDRVSWAGHDGAAASAQPERRPGRRPRSR
jgi:DNA-binding transcriptional LysR family regulator